MDCVILAAGLSSRMGKNKMTLEMGGQTVIENCVRPFYGYCSKIIVVTGKYHNDIKQCLAPYSKIQIAYNKDFLQGMFSSVKLGVKHVESRRFFLTPGDYPLLKEQTVKQMANTQGGFISPVFNGQNGHPILLDKQFIPLILNSTDISLRDCLLTYNINKKEIPVDDIGVITDIDTKNDWIKII